MMDKHRYLPALDVAGLEGDDEPLRRFLAQLGHDPATLRDGARILYLRLDGAVIGPR
jgi:hypothetical protein